MKKTKIIIIFLVIVLILLILLLTLTKKKDEEVIQPIPVYSPLPSSIGPRIITPEQEKEGEENYALEREKELKERPWILKMPIRNEDYFLSYDSELDVFNATLFISDKFDKTQQINDKKARLQKDLTKIGVDANKAKINYTETEI